MNLEDEEIEDDLEDDLVDDGAADDDDDGQDDDDLSEVEQLAVEAGWKPKAQWKGEGHVDARTYLKNAANRAKATKRENRDLEERMGALEGAHKVSLDRQIENLKARAGEMKKAAIAKGGAGAVEEVDAIDTVLDEEISALKKAAEPEPMKLTALDKASLAEHPWMFGDDTFDGEEEEEAEEAFQLYTATVAKVMEKTGDAGEAHERAGKTVRKAFPHRYEEEEASRRGERRPQRRAPDIASGYATPRERGRDLPPEALKAAKDCVSRGIYANVAEFAEVYWAERKKGRSAR